MCPGMPLDFPWSRLSAEEESLVEVPFGVGHQPSQRVHLVGQGALFGGQGPRVVPFEFSFPRIDFRTQRDCDLFLESFPLILLLVGFGQSVHADDCIDVFLRQFDRFQKALASFFGLFFASVVVALEQVVIRDQAIATLLGDLGSEQRFVFETFGELFDGCRCFIVPLELMQQLR